MVPAHVNALAAFHDPGEMVRLFHVLRLDHHGLSMGFCVTRYALPLIMQDLNRAYADLKLHLLSSQLPQHAVRAAINSNVVIHANARFEKLCELIYC